MWSDRETDRDCLGFSSYVSVLAEICLRTELAPLTLGIFGSWGSDQGVIIIADRVSGIGVDFGLRRCRIQEPGCTGTPPRSDIARFSC